MVPHGYDEKWVACVINFVLNETQASTKTPPCLRGTSPAHIFLNHLVNSKYQRQHLVLETQKTLECIITFFYPYCCPTIEASDNFGGYYYYNCQ